MSDETETEGVLNELLRLAAVIDPEYDAVRIERHRDPGTTNRYWCVEAGNACGTGGTLAVALTCCLTDLRTFIARRRDAFDAALGKDVPRG